VLVLEGRSRQDIRVEEQRAWEEMDLREHMELYLRQGMDRKEAMKAVAKDRVLGKRDVYRMLLEEE
jgi:16S rRNA (cytidine1402-2'-O)-methyltransferase